jgi:hypothetical protein
MHVVMNLILAVAAGQWLLLDQDLVAGRFLVAALTVAAVFVAAWSLIRSQSQGIAEREFTLWFRLPPGHELIYRDGWWYAEPSPRDAGETARHKCRG